MFKEELAKAGVRQLRDIARDVGITMPQKLRKEELIEQITERMEQQGTVHLPQIVPMKKRGKKSKSELEAIAAEQQSVVLTVRETMQEQKTQEQPFGMDVFGKDVFGGDVFAAPQSAVPVTDAPSAFVPPEKSETAARMPEAKPPVKEASMHVTSVYTAAAPRTPYAQQGIRGDRPRMPYRAATRPKYQDTPVKSGQQNWDVPQQRGRQQDTYAVMTERYGDTLALRRTQKTEDEDNGDENVMFSAADVQSTNDVFEVQTEQDVCGVLEILPDGYGFLRMENYCPGSNDVYVSLALIRRYALRMGDMVEGKAGAARSREKRSALLNVERINGAAVQQEERMVRPRFDKMTPVYPVQRIRLEQGAAEDISLRLIDLVAPIGKGQRALIVAPPKAGKTMLLQRMAQSIKRTDPKTHVIMLLIDERPEEVTDMQRSIDGEVVYSTFDESPERHIRVAELLLERAKRMVESGQDVVILLDSITRLARAYNLTAASGGKILSGGLDSTALFKPKAFFGAARKLEEGASLTIIATALVDTGSRLDDVIYEEFKGTGNMEVFLDRKLSQRRVFPAVDLLQSGTRHEELLMDEEELACAAGVRRILNGTADATQSLIEMMEKTQDNHAFFKRFFDWQKLLSQQM